MARAKLRRDKFSGSLLRRRGFCRGDLCGDDAHAFRGLWEPLDKAPASRGLCGYSSPIGSAIHYVGRYAGFDYQPMKSMF